MGYKGYRCKGMTKSGRKCEAKVSGCNDHIFCEDWFCSHHRDQARNIDELQREVTDLRRKMDKLEEEKEELKNRVGDLKERYWQSNTY